MPERDEDQFELTPQELEEILEDLPRILRELTEYISDECA